VEKDAVVGSIEKLTNELGVRVRPGKGFQSTTKVHEISELFCKMTKPIFVYYLGDHDPSGRNAEEELKERVHQHVVDLMCEMKSSEIDAHYHAAYFSMERLAIHGTDITPFNLPPLKVKSSDSRASGFRKKYGNRCVELDALPVVELRRRIQDAVEEHIDMESWERAKVAEEAESKCIMNFADKMQGLSHPE
jgi:hypothetical protein